MSGSSSIWTIILLVARGVFAAEFEVPTPVAAPEGAAVPATAVLAPEVQEGMSSISRAYFDPDRSNAGPNYESDLGLLLNSYRSSYSPEMKQAYALALRAYSLGPEKAAELLKQAGVEPGSAARIAIRAGRLHAAAREHPPLASMLESVQKELEDSPGRPAQAESASPVERRGQALLFEGWERRARTAAREMGGPQTLDTVLAEAADELDGQHTVRLGRGVVEYAFPRAWTGNITKKQRERSGYVGSNFAKLYLERGWGEREHEKELLRDFIRITSLEKEHLINQDDWTWWGTEYGEDNNHSHMRLHDISISAFRSVADIVSRIPRLAGDVPEVGPFLIREIGRLERILDSHASTGEDTKNNSVAEAKRTEVVQHLEAGLAAVDAIWKTLPAEVVREILPSWMSQLKWLKNHSSAGLDLPRNAGRLLEKLSRPVSAADYVEKHPLVLGSLPKPEAPEPKPAEPEKPTVENPLGLLPSMQTPAAIAAKGAAVPARPELSEGMRATRAMGLILSVMMPLIGFLTEDNFVFTASIIAILLGWIIYFMKLPPARTAAARIAPAAKAEDPELQEAMRELDQHLDRDALKKRIEELEPSDKVRVETAPEPEPDDLSQDEAAGPEKEKIAR